MGIEAAFNLPFTEAVEFFLRKLNIPTAAWDDLWEDEHALGFMIAGVMQAELLAEFREAVDGAIASGTTLENFRKEFDRLVEEYGWEYNGGRNWRSRIIYETNIRTAYQAGRWEQLTDPDVLKLYPYLEYRHGDSINPREEHLAWDGLILPADDPWWSTHYPPNGWGCKCKVFSAGKRDLKRAEKAKPDKAPTAVNDPTGIDDGWGYNVGMAAAKAKELLVKAIDDLPDDLGRLVRQALEDRKEGGARG